MDPERADRVEQLYHSALEHDTGERDAFLRQACSDDPSTGARSSVIAGRAPGS